MSDRREQINVFLNTYLTKKAVLYSQINSWGPDAIFRLKNFVKGGKLLRGQLVLSFSQKPNINSLKVAAAIELFHAGLLIHDDIIDRDQTRRNQPSIFRQYANLGQSQKIRDYQHFGVSQGINLGDFCFFLAFQLLAEISLDELKKQQLLDLFSKELSYVILSQMQDAEFGLSARIPTEKEVRQVYRYKTSRYTFSLPLTASAILSEQNQQIIAELDQLGEVLGLIYQITDDKLGIFGESKVTGKPVGGDIREAKKTLYYLYLLRATTKSEQLKLQKIFGNPKLTGEQINYVRDLLTKRNVVKIIEEELRTCEAEAKNLINGLKISSMTKAELRDLLNFCLKRNK